MTLKTKQEIIHSMCLTWRPDFGIERNEQDILGSGMSSSERAMLVQDMTQLFDNCIAPYMDFKNS